MANIGVHFQGPALHGVTAALTGAGHEVHVAADITRVHTMLQKRIVDAWVVDAAAEDILNVLVLEGSYVLPADNIPEVAARQRFNAWMDSLLGQLELALLRPPVVASINNRRQWQAVRGVWLLAGSAGATGAVQAFLSAFSEPPPVAFIYAQHLEPQLQHQLERFTPQNAAFSFELVEGSHVLAARQVLVVTPRHRITLHNSGRVNCARSPWNTEHTPDINELITLLSTLDHPDRGVILFSGMGDDGCEALPTFDASGGSIWAQSPASAASEGIPRAAIATGLVERVGEPAALAEALAARFSLSETGEKG